jgi:uncharacterized membrane protein YdfJ with MMPL/SSD domain
VITSAGLLLIIVVGAFSASSITFIKLIGVALMRVLLVPATMRLLGGANWWVPGPLRRLYARYGIHEDHGPASAAPLPAREPPQA